MHSRSRPRLSCPVLEEASQLCDQAENIQSNDTDSLQKKEGLLMEAMEILNDIEKQHLLVERQLISTLHTFLEQLPDQHQTSMVQKVQGKAGKIFERLKGGMRRLRSKKSRARGEEQAAVSEHAVAEHSRRRNTQRRTKQNIPYEENADDGEEVSYAEVEEEEADETPDGYGSGETVDPGHDIQYNSQYCMTPMAPTSMAQTMPMLLPHSVYSPQPGNASRGLFHVDAMMMQRVGFS